MKLLPRIASWLPDPRVIYDREGVEEYLSRWYLIGRPRPADPGLKGNLSDHTTSIWQRLPVNLFLHRFHRSDEGGKLHSHPWPWGVSFVLVAGYSEERRDGDEVVRRRVRPFTLNFLRGEDYHRVDLIDGQEAWTLFLVGPKTDSWYFWDRDKKMRCDWRKFLIASRAEREAAWEPDSRS